MADEDDEARLICQLQAGIWNAMAACVDRRPRALGSRAGGLQVTNAEFAKMAARLAARSASWAGDTLDLPEWWSQPVEPETVRRFAASIRETVDYIERRAAEREGERG